MSETRPLLIPKSPEDPSIPEQLLVLFSKVAQESGGYVVPHPEAHCINIVFGAHQVEVIINQRR
nr:hypothetical protein [uncultured Holophaga sp.]